MSSRIVGEEKPPHIWYQNLSVLYKSSKGDTLGEILFFVVFFPSTMPIDSVLSYSTLILQGVISKIIPQL